MIPGADACTNGSCPVHHQQILIPILQPALTHVTGLLMPPMLASARINTVCCHVQVRVCSLASFGAPASAESVNDDFSMAAGELKPSASPQTWFRL